MQNTVAVISLKKIRSNALKIKRFSGVPLIAVVKDDAYGHGAERVAFALHGIASSFAVSTVDEGAALRAAGISEEILVLTPPLDEEEVVRAAAYGLTLSLTSLAVLRLCVRTAEKYMFSISAHVAVNTGMNRYGFRPERVGSACRRAKEAGIALTGIYSHLYLPYDGRVRDAQIALFQESVGAAKTVFPNLSAHLSATGGALAGIRYDAVRAGIFLYGYLPEGFEGGGKPEPAAKFYATVAQSGRPVGGGVGYRKAEKAYKTLHTLRLGYGDGYFRRGGAGFVGSLCMDAGIREGAAKVFERRLIFKSVTEYAAAQGTTEYEVLVGLLKKAVKVYV